MLRYTKICGIWTIALALSSGDCLARKLSMAAETALLLNPYTVVIKPSTGRTAPAATTMSGGTFVINISGTIASRLPPKTAISCQAYAIPGNFPEYIESASKAAAVSGKTLTCSVKIPYLWQTDGMKESVILLYGVYATPNLLKTLQYTRLSFGSLGSVPLPKNGTTTTESATITF